MKLLISQLLPVQGTDVGVRLGRKVTVQTLPYRPGRARSVRVIHYVYVTSDATDYTTGFLNVGVKIKMRKWKH